ncbi:cellulase family glycosylhydrolase [Neptunitalea lumnitzerae]|uniref:mannan endo-1,4-beta-mannosidase n=1 Tax=Neptunitalea lumnitzerae TaxID=2965509 RepID=A0ABQ5MGM2_9FLAO|nr:cellulase family glycosylhydrolase [Neptunitalea sp. Y10]GLB48057.1 glycosyl hydrolase family 5 [Neptunitalea sp. Y10]
MVTLNKNILRGILILSFVAINALIIFGISALFTYLNTGADRSKMLHTEIQKIDQYLPTMDWAPMANEGRPMDKQTLGELESNYLDAWYVKHVAYNTNLREGIEDFYTESSRENIFNFIDLNKQQGITLEETTLEHHPKLNFFSEDGQLIMLTDNNVKEYKRVYQNKKLVEETIETATYKVLLLLEDGFWRVRHMVKTDATPNHKYHNKQHTKTGTIHGINYYPKNTPWDMFGENFEIDTIQQDFKLIHDAGLNTVRIFVPYEDFGKAKVKDEKLVKLKKVLDAAAKENIKVLITLFDFYGDYSVLDWTLNQRHAETIVKACKDHSALLGWDLKNEPDLDFKSRGKSTVEAWLRTMLELVKTTDPNHPVTIGWAKPVSAPLLKDEVDFVSFHYYEDLNQFENTYTQLKKEIPNKQLVVGEFGMSSYSGLWKPFGSSEEDQANYHKNIQSTFEKYNISYISWTLYDFENIPKEVVGSLPWRKNVQKKFGFIDKNGAKKASFDYISSSGTTEE